MRSSLVAFLFVSMVSIGLSQAPVVELPNVPQTPPRAAAEVGKPAPARPAPLPGRSATQKWEYAVLSVEPDAREMEKALNETAVDGWELDRVEPIEGKVFLIFKIATKPDDVFKPIKRR